MGVNSGRKDAWKWFSSRGANRKSQKLVLHLKMMEKHGGIPLHNTFPEFSDKTPGPMAKAQFRPVLV